MKTLSPNTVHATSRAKRRGFQFSMRTLFVVLTLLACAAGWLGRNVHQVRQRAETARELELHGGDVMPSIPRLGLEAQGHLPFTWWLLGARPVFTVSLGESHPEDDRSRIERLFPEAIVLPHIIYEGPLLSVPDRDDWDRMIKRRGKRSAELSLSE